MLVSLTSLRAFKIFFLSFVFQLGQVGNEHRQAGRDNAVHFVVVSLTAALAVSILLLFKFFKQEWADLLGYIERELGAHVVQNFLDVHMDL
jgi:hypothetical protein